MNSVHEPGLNSDSETVLSQKLSQKQAGCTKCTACWPSQHTQVCTGARMPGRIVGATAVVSQDAVPCRRRPSAVSWPSVARPSAVSQDTPVGQSPPPPPPQVTIHLLYCNPISIQASLNLSRYKICSVTRFPCLSNLSRSRYN